MNIDQVSELAALDCQLVGVTGESVPSIITWAPEDLGYPIISDKSLDMAKAFGVKRKSGMMCRGTFILDRERRVRHCSVYPRIVARSPGEVVRQVAVAREVDSRPEQEILAGRTPSQEAVPSTVQGFIEEEKKEVEIKSSVSEGPQLSSLGDLFTFAIMDSGNPMDLQYFLQGE